MQIFDKNIDELIPYENNPRKNDAAVDKVAESLKTFGWQQPIVIDQNNVIVAGHTRFKAAQKLGMKTVPVKYADDLTGEEIKAYRLADNKTNEFSEWDFEMLDTELQEINDIDMGEFGFSNEDLPDFNIDEPLGNSDREKLMTCPKCGFEWKI